MTSDRGGWLHCCSMLITCVLTGCTTLPVFHYPVFSSLMKMILPPGVKGICQGSSPVYGHMLDALGPRAPLELTVVKCFVDYFGKSSVDAVARCIKAAFQAAFPNYIASVNIVNFRMTTSTETGYVLQGSSEDCELFIVWDFP